MTNKAFFYVTSLLVFPIVFALFFTVRLVGRTYGIDQWIPKWDTLLLIVMMMLVERVYTYKLSVSQRPVLARDLMSNVVNIYVTGAVTGLIVLPVLAFFPEHFLGRKLVLTSRELLGPVWLQALIICISLSFYRYWMHRLQHSVGFLWRFHSYHHRVTDLQATNTYVSHPIDFALRNVLFGLVLGIIGFNPLALAIATSVTFVPGVFSHCGGDVKAGVLSYLFVTPEVHRWHHSSKVPEGYGHSCNYGVEFSFWDIVFGTFYLPVKAGVPQPPEHIGYPGGGLPDEGNYIKLLLAPLGLYRPLSWFAQPRGQQPAE
jgi:sterol desaturase/sphingolipid hydroxylase (fatty acid hydroxylase superfamily)